MALLAVVVLLVVLAGWRNRRPLKLVLSEAEAQAVKARWWAAARRELEVWGIVAVIGFAVLAEPLGSLHWRPFAYAAVAWGSLMLFSRLAIWGTLGVGLLGYGALAATSILGRPICQPIVVMAPIIACVFAILIRFVLLLFFGSPSQPVVAQHAPVEKATLP